MQTCSRFLINSSANRGTSAHKHRSCF
jgi:hypothetical protein